jgi:antitoxin FitA
MAQLLVRGIDEDVKERLRRRAKRNGRSMEEEVRQILHVAVRSEERTGRKLSARIAARFKNLGPLDVAELRGHRVRPARFDE